ncbi:phosphatase PAP2 family protein [Gemella cuniculi]|uniref:phosphatase PAP2 family protein n=1 Tax=Gemella cuniculi TaxID=150240 RepID=UPI0003FFBAD8|nr:phosphatase PAP2 family protein [Gemella cuniculi]
MKYKKYILIMIVAFSIFVFIRLTYETILKPMDINVIDFVQKLENSTLTSFYKEITNVADTYQNMVITIVLVIILCFKKYHYEAIYLAISMATCGVLIPIIKNMIKRPRPDFHRLLEIGGFSFPSGHTTSATILYLTLVLISIKIFKNINKYFVLVLASFGILVIAISRVYLGVHYPTDTLGGMSLGVGVVAFYYMIFYKTKLLEKF